MKNFMPILLAAMLGYSMAGTIGAAIMGFVAFMISGGGNKN
jgi:hypothetical protein